MKAKVIGNGFVHFDDGTTWPRIDGQEGSESIEWILRYSTPTLSDLLTAAGYIAAYNSLIGKTQRRRNEICEALKEVEETVSSATPVLAPKPNGGAG